jgi:hypothetical protein
MGCRSVANGNGAIAMGERCVAGGNNCYAGGKYTFVNNASSAFVYGDHLEVETSNVKAVFGSYNKDVDAALFVVGNGSSSTDRKNALTLDKAGNLQISGSFKTAGNLQVDGNLTVKTGPKNSKDVATKEYVDKEIANIDIPEIDLSNYATVEYVNSKVRDLDSAFFDSLY